MDPAPRSLVVVRHAKSDWSSMVPDAERPLNARGRSDAPVVGRWLADLGLAVDAAVVSPAVRTRQTWGLLAGAAGIAREPAFVPGVYGGSEDDLAEAVRGIDGSARCAVLVCHAPGCHDFVEWVTQGEGEADAFERMRSKYPTAAAALIDVSADWAGLAPGDGRLRAFEVCRG